VGHACQLYNARVNRASSTNGTGRVEVNCDPSLVKRRRSRKTRRKRKRRKRRRDGMMRRCEEELGFQGAPD